jgi:hypothetical protein
MSKSGALSSTCPKFFQNECRPIPDLPVGSCRLWYILSGTACLSWHLDWQRPDPVICKKLAAWLRCICRRWLPLGMWWSDPSTSHYLWAYWPFLLASGGWSMLKPPWCRTLRTKVWYSALQFHLLLGRILRSYVGHVHPSSSWAWSKRNS